MRFKRVYIEITNICNLNCSFCPKLKRSPRHMSCYEFERVAAEVRPYSEYIYLHVKGEPLSHPELDNILTICDNFGFKVNITSNGTLLKKQLDILRSHNSIRQLNISLHSMETEEKAKTYINEIIECTDVLKNYFMISFRIWTYDCSSLSQSIILNRLQEKYNIEIIPENGRAVLSKNVYFSLGETFEWPSVSGAFISDTGYCLGTRSQLAVLSNGYVVPCCLDSEGDINLGNLFEEDLCSILNSYRFKRMNSSLNNRNLSEELCKRCSYRLRFNKK